MNSDKINLAAGNVTLAISALHDAYGQVIKALQFELMEARSPVNTWSQKLTNGELYIAIQATHKAVMEAGPMHPELIKHLKDLLHEQERRATGVRDE